MNIEKFRASRFCDEDDPLLEKHANNPALHVGDSPYFSDRPPAKQYLYQYSDIYGLIAEQKVGEKSYYCMWWGQGGDECYRTLEEAEVALFNFMSNEGVDGVE